MMFSSPDTLVPYPYHPMDWNRYLYARANPVNVTDPSGHSACWDGNGGDKSCANYTLDSNGLHRKERTSVLQVNLAEHEPINQYDYADKNDVGYMGCGITAACSAGADFETVSRAAQANGYTKDWGMQPSQAERTYKDVYGVDNVSVNANWTLEGVYDALESGKAVIVDLLVQNVNGNYSPSSTGTTSHFARVLGVDWKNRKVYIENTLPGSPYWELTFEEFKGAWYNPEERATPPRGMPPDKLDHVGYWGAAVPIQSRKGH